MNHSTVSILLGVILRLLFIQAAHGVSAPNQVVMEEVQQVRTSQCIQNSGTVGVSSFSNYYAYLANAQQFEDGLITPADKNDDSSSSGVFRGQRLVTESVKMPEPTRGFSFDYDAMCKNKIATHVVKPTDDGKSISLKYYPQDDIQETWASIITCNTILRSSYSNATEMSFAVPKPFTKLHIPDKGEVIRSIVLQSGLVSSDGVMNEETAELLCNCGEEEIMVSEATNLGKIQKNLFEHHDKVLLVLCNPHIQMKKNVVLPGQTLKVPCTDTEKKMKLDSAVAAEQQDGLTTFDSQQNFTFTPDTHDRQLIATGPQGNNWNRWDAYSCTHSKNDAYGDRTWIFRGSDLNCQGFSTRKRLTDGCSLPTLLDAISPFKHIFQPGCTVHDLCYQFSYWKDPVNWPLTATSRVRCDEMGFELWKTACYQNYMWNPLFLTPCLGEAYIWTQVLLIHNQGQPTGGATYLDDYERESVMKYSVASLFVPSTTSAPGWFEFADVFRQRHGEIRSRMNNKCLDLYQDKVHMHTCHGLSNQKWYRPRFSKYDMRITGGDNKCLDAPGGQGVRVYWHWCHNGNNQKWIYDDKYRLHNVMYPDLCLDIYAWDNNDLAKVVLWPCNDQKNQQWYQPQK